LSFFRKDESYRRRNCYRATFSEIVTGHGDGDDDGEKYGEKYGDEDGTKCAIIFGGKEETVEEKVVSFWFNL
jgi:hypothetical protein